MERIGDHLTGCHFCITNTLGNTAESKYMMAGLCNEGFAAPSLSETWSVRDTKCNDEGRHSLLVEYQNDVDPLLVPSCSSAEPR
jgi:hypothetical protein